MNAPRSGEVLTPKLSAIRRTDEGVIHARRRRASPLDPMTFAFRCAAGAVAMRSTFDRLREVRNRPIYQVILNRCWVLEKAPPSVGLVVPEQPVVAGPAALTERLRKLSNDLDIRTARSTDMRLARRQRTQEFAHDAWYVDCTSRLRGSAEGEEIQ